MNIYFDCAATAPLDIKIFEKVLKEYPTEFLFGNPSSIHYNGVQAKKILEKARNIIAEELKCKPTEIYFTSGGSESNNMALKGIMLQYEPKQAELITTTIEHPSVLNTCKQLENMGYTIKYVSPNQTGTIDINEIEELITPKTKLVSIMRVNNELGMYTNEIDWNYFKGKYSSIVFHSDMVQSVMNYDLRNADMVSFSGHKFGSITGVGILYKKENIKLVPLINGGGQERNLRGGTENVFGIIDMALCFQKNRQKWGNKDKVKSLRQFKENIINSLKDNNIDFLNLTPLDLGLDNVLTIALHNIDSSVLQLWLSQQGICISTGSACHSNTTEEISYVIKSINVPKEYQKGIIRISMPYGTKETEVNIFIKELIDFIKHLLR